jgi:hypothetical protein
MIKTQLKKDPLPKQLRRESNWAQYLDYTLFIEQDFENEQLEKFMNDLL